MAKSGFHVQLPKTVLMSYNPPPKYFDTYMLPLSIIRQIQLTPWSYYFTLPLQHGTWISTMPRLADCLAMSKGYVLQAY